MIDERICPQGHVRTVSPCEVCPRCGAGMEVRPHAGNGHLVASLELSAPAEGWPAPHRLGLVELEGGTRLVVLLDRDLDDGVRGTVERDGQGRYAFRPG